MKPSSYIVIASNGYLSICVPEIFSYQASDKGFPFNFHRMNKEFDIYTQNRLFSLKIGVECRQNYVFTQPVSNNYFGDIVLDPSIDMLRTYYARKIFEYCFREQTVISWSVIINTYYFIRLDFIHGSKTFCTFLFIS